jgi:hypothetical protein
VRWAGAFAAYGSHGTTASSTIVYEIEPGGRLGWHTDAASACRNDITLQVDSAAISAKAILSPARQKP